MSFKFPAEPLDNLNYAARSCNTLTYYLLVSNVQ